MLRQLISKSTTSHHNMCHYHLIHSRLYKTQEKTTTITKHSKENKSDKTNFQRFPQSKDVERIYNRQYLQSSLVYIPHKQPFHLSFISISVQFAY